MSGVKQICQVNGCNRAASTRCFCCKKNVCTRHFTEHIDAVKAQIDPLANETNVMMEKIQGLTIEKTTEACFASLQQWKIDMHQLIEEIFLTKIKEIEDLVAENKEKFVEHRKQQLENIMQIQDDVKQLVEDGDATFEQIQLLKSRLVNVETNLASFGKDFLSVNAEVLAQGLVIVSSNLNKPSVSQYQATNQPPPQTPRDLRRLKKREMASLIADSATKPTFDAFGSAAGAQTNPTTTAASATKPLFGGFGSTADAQTNPTITTAPPLYSDVPSFGPGFSFSTPQPPSSRITSFSFGATATTASPTSGAKPTSIFGVAAKPFSFGGGSPTSSSFNNISKKTF